MLHNWARAYLFVPQIVTRARFTVLFGHSICMLQEAKIFFGSDSIVICDKEVKVNVELLAFPTHRLSNMCILL